MIHGVYPEKLFTTEPGHSPVKERTQRKAIERTDKANTEDRGQRTEDRGQRTEDRGQETEVFSPSSDIRLPFKSQVPVCFPFFLHARFLFSVFSVSLLRKGLVGCAPLTPGTPPTDLSMVQGVPTGHEML
jgi:hypothetical protein